MASNGLMVFAVLVTSLFTAFDTARAESNVVTCRLEKGSTDFAGSCEVPCRVNALAIDIDGPRMSVACDTPPRRVSATLRQPDVSNSWLGTMEGKHPEDPTRFEVVKPRGDAPGIAKTPFGWFALQKAETNGNAIVLTIAANRQLPPTADDIRIIQRALDLVSSEKVWNREDTRTCPPNPQRWSVFCALTQATTEVSGGIHYRQPALQAVREVLNEVGGNRINKHRLMDYNNHPDTTLAEIHSLLKVSQSRLEKRFR